MDFFPYWTATRAGGGGGGGTFEQDEDVHIFLLLKYIIFILFCTALLNQQKILAYFP